MMSGVSKPTQGSTPPPADIRDTLFGDMPIEMFPLPADKPPLHEPWTSFVQARENLAAGRVEEAKAIWLRITEMPDHESRIYCQAWHFLRAHGVKPAAEIGKRLLGIVVEVPMNGGLDLLAAYPEHTARYYNYSGAGVVWEHPNDSLDGLIDAFLAGGEWILQAIGPWDKPRPAAPPLGSVRINILSPSGLHFGQGTFATLAADPMAKPLIDAARALMQQLVALNPRGK